MNVIKIAICDDEEKVVALHERIVKACLQSQGIGYEITTYTQSRNLLCDITDDGFFYDLILLDIEMPGTSGMEIPQQLKGFLPNVRIIFVTSHTEYAIDAFELSIFRYVPKNNLEVKLAAFKTLNTMRRFCRYAQATSEATEFNLYSETDHLYIWIRMITRFRDYNVYVHYYDKAAVGGK